MTRPPVMAWTTERARQLLPDVSEEEAGFLRNIVANQWDDGLLGVYADWLDEHDLPDEAQVIRDEIGVLARDVAENEGGEATYKEWADAASQD